MARTLANLRKALDRRIAGDADIAKMDNAINIALEKIGDVTQVDESLEVVNNQTEYSLPAGVEKVVRLEVANSASEDYDYQIDYSWRVINGKLYFPDSLSYSPGNKIRLYYNAPHSEVDEDSDTISNMIPDALLLAMATYYYHLEVYADQMNMGTKDPEVLAAMRDDMYAAELRYSVRKMTRDPILNTD